jgi:hypothetical protein
MQFTNLKDKIEKKIKNSSHKLSKLQLTNFWSQGILGIKATYVGDRQSTKLDYNHRVVYASGLSFS